MTFGKRIVDLSLAVLLSVLLLPVCVVLMVILLIVEGRPLFYVSERMHSPDRAFALIKFRTMRTDTQNTGVTGGDKAGRVGPLHRVLRKTRLDELPQLWNVLCGDMSFVGPRPPLRVYVTDFPELYKKVLRNRPGITGLASLVYHQHEERLLAVCTTAEETDHAYRTRCVPTKARLDLIYQRHANLCYDFALMARTAGKLFRRG